MRKVILMVAAALALSSCATDVVDAGFVSGNIEGAVVADDDVFPGWVRVKLESQASPLNVGFFTRGAVSSGNVQLDEVAARLGATQIRRVYSDGGKFAERRRQYGLHLWYDLKVDDNISVTRATDEVMSVPGVAVALPVYRIKLANNDQIAGDLRYAPALNSIRPTVEMPFNDPELNKQWHYYNDGSTPGSIPGADINLFAGWKNFTKGSADVTVAVMDVGVDYRHPDLAANMWVNKNEVSGNGIDDDDNGYIDDIYGWNYSDNITIPIGTGKVDPGNHATHIAGTISAVNNNGIGVSGVAGGSGNNDGVKIMTLAFFANSGYSVPPSGDMFAYAADNGAVIASCSWDLNIAMPQDLLDGMTYFYENAGMNENNIQTGPVKGGTMIFAAGNENNNVIKHPGKYDMCISVAAMAADYTKASYSSYGSEVDIMAPGGEEANLLGVYSTMINGGYGYMYGTSMATPHVSGAAALIASYFKGDGFTAQMLREKLLASYIPADVAPAYANFVGVGMLDVSLIGLTKPTTTPAAITNAMAIGLPDKIKISCTTPADGNGMPITKYVLEYKGIEGNGVAPEWTTLTLTNNVKVGEKYEYTFELIQLTKYSFKLTPYDRFGTKGSVVIFEGTTLEHTNTTPKVRSKFMDIELANVGDKYIRRFDLGNYFVDSDVSYGDKLTFTTAVTGEEVVDVKLEDEGRKLVLTPLCKGTAAITIRATDLKGLYIESKFSYTVKAGGDCGDKPDPDPDPDPTPKPEGISLYPNPAPSVINVKIGIGLNIATIGMRIVDGAGRMIMDESLSLNAERVIQKNISSLSPGVYTVIVNVAGKRYVESFMKI